MRGSTVLYNPVRVCMVALNISRACVTLVKSLAIVSMVIKSLG